MFISLFYSAIVSLDLGKQLSLFSYSLIQAGIFWLVVKFGWANVIPCVNPTLEGLYRVHGVTSEIVHHVCPSLVQLFGGLSSTRAQSQSSLN